MANADTSAAILEWLSSAEASMQRARFAGSPQSQEAQEFRLQLCSKFIPSLTKGSEDLKELGYDDEEFAVMLKECTELLQKLGGPVEVGEPPSCAQDSYVLNILKSPLPTAVLACKSMYEELVKRLEQTGLSNIEEAEACLRILQHLQAKLFDGSRKCIELNRPDEYLALAEDCSIKCSHLGSQIASHRSSNQPADEFIWEWRPYKLIDSVLDRHTNLIRCVDRLHDDFGAEFQELHLKFPEIVVVGTESVGKSSVMEKLAGVPIFPRGEGVTTRKSFRLRLHHLSESEMALRKRELPPGQQPSLIRNTEVLMKFEGAAEYVLDHEQVRKKVQQANQEVADKGLGVDKGEIVLNMYSTVFPDLTLLDMPGLIRARGERDPQDIVQKCEDLVKEKIGHEDAIVLAVLNARANSVRGTAEGIRIVQQLNAESRTLAVLTCVDRTDAEDEVPAVMRQTAGLELPALGYHYHAVIGRDVKRTAAGKRAEKADCERFEQAVREHDLAGAAGLLEQNRVSEESLTSAMQLGAVAAAAEHGTQELARKVREKLEETRREQDRFEDRYFQPLAAGAEMTAWQREQRVDPMLLAPDLGEYLGSGKLGSRLSEMLENHIRTSWAPKMSDAVRRKQLECANAKARCGDAPAADCAAALSMIAKLVERFRGLVVQRKGELSTSVLACIAGNPACPRPPRLSSTRTHFPDTWGGQTCVASSVESAASSAEQVIEQGKGQVEKLAKSCLSDDEPALCLARFPVFRAWVLFRLSQLLETKRQEAAARFSGFHALLEADTLLPGEDPAALQQRLTLQMGEVLPRILHKHFVAQVLAELPALLLDVPALTLFNGKPLLTESVENAERRRKIESQLTALARVREELRPYEQAPPHHFVCPISKEVMVDPVVAEDGHSYDRESLLQHLQRDSRSPLTRMELGPSPQLNPNRQLKNQILEWKTTPVKKRPQRQAR